jgi:endonuclease/exonuclease/phosphatase family metal-dependent hydrolase
MSSGWLDDDGARPLGRASAGPSFAPADDGESTEEIYRLVRDEIAPHLVELARCQSTRQLVRHRVYRRLEPVLRTVLETPERGDLGSNGAPPRSAYRFVAWNIERGIELDRQIEAVRSHPYLRGADVLLLTETDLGMARSGNRHVAREIACELGYHYAFVPCYLNLSKGSGLEYLSPGENELGLHGNAVLSRYPIGRARPIHLENGTDLMVGREKRLGRQTALAVEIEFPNGRLAAVSLHLDANSSQRHRCRQMREVLDGLRPEIASGTPVVIGGDWNTSTYNSSRAIYAIPGFWLRVLMGVENVIQNHYLHPYRRFERDLFQALEERGFDYRHANVIGERTATYDAYCTKTRQNLGEWIPGWCFAFIRWSLRNHDGRCPIKIDWFATRGLRTRNPVVIHELREGREVPLSDHDPVGVEVTIGEAGS